jgi:hypothetical protein
MGPIQDGLQFQHVMLLILLLPHLSFNFSLKVIFFCLVSIYKIAKFNHKQDVNKLSHLYIMTQMWFHKEMPSTTVTVSRYDDTFNTEPTHGISCCCIYYRWLMATSSRLLQTCTAHLHFLADGMKKESLCFRG